MTPMRLHRYEIPINEAVEAILGDLAGDCQRWEMRLVGDSVIIDVVEPAAVGSSPAQTIAQPASPTPAKADAVAEASPPPSPAPAEDERKGGPLARRAAMMCHERGFWTFTDVMGSEEAADWLRKECQIASRADLDHDQAAAARFQAIESKYGLWLQGYDV